jgi:hypothetical protein
MEAGEWTAAEEDRLHPGIARPEFPEGSGRGCYRYSSELDAGAQIVVTEWLAIKNAVNAVQSFALNAAHYYALCSGAGGAAAGAGNACNSFPGLKRTALPGGMLTC